MNLNRRGFLGVLAGAIAAPIIVKAASIMPVRALDPWPIGFTLADCDPGMSFMTVSGVDHTGAVVMETVPFPTHLAQTKPAFRRIDRINVVAWKRESNGLVEGFITDRYRPPPREPPTRPLLDYELAAYDISDIERHQAAMLYGRHA